MRDDLSERWQRSLARTRERYRSQLWYQGPVIFLLTTLLVAYVRMQSKGGVSGRVSWLGIMGDRVSSPTHLTAQATVSRSLVDEKGGGE